MTLSSTVTKSSVRISQWVNCNPRLKRVVEMKLFQLPYLFRKTTSSLLSEFNKIITESKVNVWIYENNIF